MAGGGQILGNSTAGSGAQGGGIYANQVQIESGGRVAYNQTFGDTSNGGGIFVKDSVNLMGALINDNSTTGAGAEGGGVSAGGQISVATATISNSTITRNSTAGSSSQGGGIYAHNLILTSSTVTGNSTRKPSGMASSAGGGIYVKTTGNFANNIILGNAALDSASKELHFGGSASYDFVGNNIIGANGSIYGFAVPVGETSIIHAFPADVFKETESTRIDADANGSRETPSAFARSGKLDSNGGRNQSIALLPDALNPAIDSTAAPVSVFSFEGDADDGFGNNDGTLQGGLLADAFGAPGVSDSAIELTGDGSEFVQLSSPLTIGDKSSTVEVWVKVPSIESGGVPAATRVGVILGSFSNINPLNANWEIHDDGQMRVFWKNGERNIFGSTDLRDDQWHHLAFVRDNSPGGEFHFYVDGKEETLTGTKTAGSDFTLSRLIELDKICGVPRQLPSTDRSMN